MSNFLTNYSETTFLERIRACLMTCDSFAWSVSFIKKAGLVLLKEDIEYALKRGCEGKIITSTYQNFTDIESLRTFQMFSNKYKNFECHLDYDSILDKKSYESLGFHTKGYVFTKKDEVEMIIGSSNITRFALLKNVEWDLDIIENKNSKTFVDVCIEFDNLWKQTKPLTSELINQYSKKLYYAIEKWDMDYELSYAQEKPNYMQRKALKEIGRYRALGVDRALVIAAAGSGKTYLSAFDALNFDPKKLLYIVHESSILEKSLETFKNVFGDRVSYGLYAGGKKDIDTDFLFATNISMVNSLELFSKEEFDYIIIDECHHVIGETYMKIIDYFKPQFLLGLTATPERMDGEDIFSVFDKNVPFVLRLRDAIANGLVVPFKYKGIRDTLVNYGLTGSQERKMINESVSPAHVEFIVDSIEENRVTGKLKALAFCRNRSHARMMCDALSQNYKTAYLTGDSKTGERIKAYEDLQKDEGGIEVLCTVDILNEGVDIPGVNMVLFLRPTDSSTIFIQQLGRGLRKYENKEYVRVLDFVGNNYKRSVQVAFALSSLANNFVLEKKLVKDLIRTDFAALDLAKYGVEIQFDEFSKNEILEYIENENFNNKNYLEQDYRNFKQYLNVESYPKHMDYLNSDCAPDLIRFMQVKMASNGKSKKNKSYYSFLSKINEDIPSFSDKQIDLINYLSEMLPLVRPYEYLIFRHMIEDGIESFDSLSRKIESEYKNFTKKEFDHAFKYITENGWSNIRKLLSQELNEYLLDLIKYGLTKYRIDYGDVAGLKEFNTYRIEQVQLLLCNNPGYTAKGTYKKDGEIYIFAGLKKDQSISEKLNYNDKFLNSKVFQWESEHDIKKASPVNEKDLLKAEIAHVFVRKVEEENGITQPFIYVGTGKLNNSRPVKERSSLLFDIILEHELPQDLQFDLEVPKFN